MLTKFADAKSQEDCSQVFDVRRVVTKKCPGNYSNQ